MIMMASLESKSALANVVVGTIVALVVIQQLHLTCLAANTIGQSAESDETTEAVVAVAVAAAEDNQSGDIDDGDMKLVDSDGALDDPTIDDNEDGNNINNRSTQRAFNLRDFFGSSSILKSSGTEDTSSLGEEAENGRKSSLSSNVQQSEGTKDAADTPRKFKFGLGIGIVG